MEPTYLRKLIAHDASALYELIETNRHHLSGFSWISSMRSVEDAHSFIQAAQLKEGENGAPTRAIHIDGEAVGVAAIHPIDWTKREASLGFWIDKSQSGCGLATRAVGNLIEHAFTTLDLAAVTVATDIHNTAPRAVVEKLGFVLAEVNNQATWRVEEGATPVVAHYRLQSDARSLSR